MHAATEEIAVPRPRAQWPALAVAAGAAAWPVARLLEADPVRAVLLGIGLALGLTLYHASFGFTGAYRAALRGGDVSGVLAQIVMLAVASALFAPVLAEGRALGHGVVGAVAPVGVAMVTGAFLFGIGMQVAGGCASGTLYTAGGGSPRMWVVLVFFCAGCFLATLHWSWWAALPRLPAIALGDAIGWGPALAAQLAVLAALYAVLRRRAGPAPRPLWWRGALAPGRLVAGPWPLLLGAVLLALLNWATLLVSGHPWTITWGFTLWAAKVALALGWDPAGSDFWTGGFAGRALEGSVLADDTSVMNIGILAGALLAAALAGRLRPRLRLGWRPLGGAVLGGLALGYGARLAYGCNIGAFASGVASTSLHGWVWILAALAGNALGLRLRPWFGLEGARPGGAPRG